MIIFNFSQLPTDYCLICQKPLKNDAYSSNVVFCISEKYDCHYYHQEDFCIVSIFNQYSLKYHIEKMEITKNGKTLCALPFIELDFSDLNAMVIMLDKLVNFI